MITEKMRKVFSEVDAFLDIIDEEHRNKVPMKLRNLYEKEKLQNYMPKYDISIPIEKQAVQRETIAMIALLHLNYWCNSEEEKQEIKKILNENEKKYQNELHRKYNSNNIFNKDNTQLKMQENTINSKEIVTIDCKESLLKRFLNKIKDIFKKK